MRLILVVVVGLVVACTDGRSGRGAARLGVNEPAEVAAPEEARRVVVPEQPVAKRNLCVQTRKGEALLCMQWFAEQGQTARGSMRVEGAKGVVFLLDASVREDGLTVLSVSDTSGRDTSPECVKGICRTIFDGPDPPYMRANHLCKTGRTPTGETSIALECDPELPAELRGVM